MAVRKNISRIIVTLLVLVTAVLCMSPAAYAAKDTVSDINYDACKVYDEGDLLTDAEEKEVNAAILKAAKRNKMNVAILTTEDSALTSESKVFLYGDEFYDSTFGFDADGVMMVVSMQNRYVDLLMNELGNDRYNLERENLLDVIQPKLSAANYKGACVSFADNLAFKIVPCIIIALIIIGILTIIMFIIASSYKFHAKTSAKNYAYGNNVVYRVQTDNFIRTYTTKHKIESNSGGHSGGGHSGGGGRSHGGRHF